MFDVLYWFLCRASEEQAKPKPTRPASRLKKTVTCYDENDVAYKVL